MRRPVAVLAAGLVLAGAFWAAPARADVIHLTNGRVLRGRVTVRAGGMTTIQLDNGGRVTIPSEQIESIEPMEKQPPPPPEPEPAPVAEPSGPKEGAKPAPATEAGGEGSAKGQEKGMDPAEIKRKAEELAPRIRELIDQVGTEGADNEEARASARAELVKIGEPAAELLVETLRAPSILRQEEAAEVLGAMGSKRTIKPLLKALDELTTPEGVATDGDVEVLNAMAAAFNRITGQFFPYDAKDIEDARIVVAQMQDWWNENAAKFPDQIGDPPSQKPAGEKPAEVPPAGAPPAAGPEPKSAPKSEPAAAGTEAPGEESQGGNEAAQ